MKHRQSPISHNVKLYQRRNVVQKLIVKEYKADENLTKIRELEFQLHRVTDIAEQYEDLCHENMLDRQEKEEIIWHLDEQIAALSASDSGKKPRKHRNRPKSVTNLQSGQNKKKQARNIISIESVTDASNNMSLYNSGNKHKESVHKYIPNHFNLWPQNEFC